MIDERFEPCPYCEDGEVRVDPDTLDGVCPECDALATFDPPELSHDEA